MYAFFVTSDNKLNIIQCPLARVKIAVVRLRRNLKKFFFLWLIPGNEIYVISIYYSSFAVVFDE